MSSQESAAVNTQDEAARVGELTAQDWIEWLDSEQASVLGTEPDSLDGLFSLVDGETGPRVVQKTGQDVQEVKTPEKRSKEDVPLAIEVEQEVKTPEKRSQRRGARSVNAREEEQGR